jgi:hypothetical protein
MKHDLRSRSLFPPYFIRPSHQTVSVCVSAVVARQRLSKTITAVTNILATIEELLNLSFFVARVVLRKVFYYVSLELVKYYHTVTNSAVHGTCIISILVFLFLCDFTGWKFVVESFLRHLVAIFTV